jgi:hypothetical protein
MDAAAIITVYRFAHVALEPAWPASLGSSEPYRRGSLLGKAGAIA